MNTSDDHQLAASRSREYDRVLRALSHDLRAPLRQIRHLAEWIEDDAGEHLPTDSRQHLRQLVVRAARATTLVADLVDFGRAGGSGWSLEEVPLGVVMAEVAKKAELPARFTLTWPERLPTVRGPRLVLQTILLELVRNAHHHHDLAEGHIRLAVEDAVRGYRLEVRDDGPGIPASEQRRVFEFMTTLRHPAERSGLGLCTVQKLVGRAGGEVWIESAGRGTCVGFHWPDPEDEHEP